MSSTSSPNASEQLLAAIVFTDVAGFSSRVEVEESVTLALLERDFTTMRLFSTMHSGKVIKSTGDGLLIFFTSAVQAVEWALKTQRHFADQATNLPPKEVLRHRVGIHLGDVFVGGGDVMGDGVNVAARVQTEARAGGICISQVVYGVVKNKLKLDVVRLETRKLKNINEVIPMYHVLLEPPALQPPPVAPVAPKAEEKVAAPKSAFSSRNLTVAALVLAVGGGVAALLLQAHREHEKELAGSQEMRNALGAALQTETTAPVAAVTPAPVPAATVPVTVAPAVPPAADEFNFLKMTGSQPAAGATPAEERALQRAHECIRVLDGWRAPALTQYTKDKPLVVRPLRGPARQTMTVFTDAKQQLYFAEGGAVRPRQWADLKPEVQGAIVGALLMGSSVPLTRDVVRGAEAFAFVHGLPELAANLVRE